jgi:hypothetical protein
MRGGFVRGGISLHKFTTTGITSDTRAVGLCYGINSEPALNMRKQTTDRLAQGTSPQEK